MDDTKHAHRTVTIMATDVRWPPTLAALVFCLLFCFSFPVLGHQWPANGSPPAPPPPPPQAAIVRRLYYPAAGTRNSNPYRSAVPPPAPAPPPPSVHRIHLARGIARVTPISLQSPVFDTNVRVGAQQATDDGGASPSLMLQKPTTTLIKVTDLDHNNNNQTIRPIVTTTTTTTTTPHSETITTRKAPVPSGGSSRLAKSLDQDAEPPASSSPVSASPSTSTTWKPTESGGTGDNLCFLSHGGSSETFTVNEAMPVNSVIGTIKVIGDVTEQGNIELSLIIGSNQQADGQNETIPIRIEPGTKNLVLVRKLDKESVEGESSVTIGVRCRPRRRQRGKKLKKLGKKFMKDLTTTESLDANQVQDPALAAAPPHDPPAIGPDSDESAKSYWTYDAASPSSGSQDDIIIPIRILVTDANDNKPEWQGSLPYTANVSEMAAIGSVLLTGIRAVDNDQLGPYSTVEYYVEPGPYSHLVRFSSPLEGTLILAGQLDYETLPQFWVTIRAQDQGNPPNTAQARVEIRVLDADDQNPRFEMDKYTATLGEGQLPGHPLPVRPKPIRAEDPDRGIRSPIVYEFHSKEEDSRETGYFRIDPNTGQVTVRGPLPGSLSLPITLVVRATQADNRDRYALTTLTILHKRDQVMPQLRFLHTNYSTSLLESTPPGQVVLTAQLSAQHNNGQRPVRFQIIDDEQGYFAVKDSGEIVVKRPLDYEKHHQYTFRVMATDGRQTDLARITVDIINVNEHDPVFSQPSYLFHVNEARLRMSPVIGQIQATDADDGDRVQLSLSGPHANAFLLSSTDGSLRLRSLRLVNTTECHMIVTATDSGTPPRSSSASVVVKLAPALVKPLTAGGAGRSLEALLMELEQQQQQQHPAADDDQLAAAGNGISPTAVDILQHSAANIFSASTNSTALVLVIVLGVLLGTLFIIIVALTLHVLKNRKYESRGRCANSSPVTLHHRHHAGSLSSSTSSSSSSSDLSLNNSDQHGAEARSPGSHAMAPRVHEAASKPGSRCFLPSPAAAAAAPPLLRSNKIVPLTVDSGELSSKQQPQSGTRPQASSSDQMDSAISSDLSCSSETVGAKPTSTAASPPPPLQPRPCSSNSTVDTAGSDPPAHVAAAAAAATVSVASRISVIRWPQGSIPRRVKKLTWKDEQRNNHLDQLYAGNTIVQAAVTTAKTKTLSGHLLTGVVPNGSSVTENSSTNAGHYHLRAKMGQTGSSTAAVVRHHQTPHYPPPPPAAAAALHHLNAAAAGPPQQPATVQQQQPHHHHHHHHHHHQDPGAALPDLTVYF